MGDYADDFSPELGAALLEESGSVDDGGQMRDLLERTNELLEQQCEVLVTQRGDLLQLQTNINCVFLAVCVLAGVVIGCAVSYVLHDLWRA